MNHSVYVLALVQPFIKLTATI